MRQLCCAPVCLSVSPLRHPLQRCLAVMGCDVLCDAVGYFCSVEIFGSE
jgi:hypothetical protein